MKNQKNKHHLKATVYDKKGRVLAVGENSYEKTHPKMACLAKKTNKPDRIYLHAEIAALVKVRSGTPYKIFVERYDSKGNPKLAAPCPICMMAIKEAGIKRIEYTVG
jgi:tRNA(Arg) A34 adenosine deaminase TadA